jgi:hypothetical protein
VQRAFEIGARVVLAIVAVGCAIGLAVGGLSIFRSAIEQIAAPGYAMAIALAGIAGAVLARRGLPPGKLLERIPRFAFIAGAVAIALATGIWAHWKIQKGVPDVPDELGYLHQARTFADGWLVAPSPPLSEFHYVSWGTHDAGQWYAVFPPGYGVLLAGGVVVGAPWIVNPLLGAALALVIFALARRVFDDDGAGARLAVLVYLASWFRLVHAGSFMSHPTAALCAALAVLGAWRGLAATGSRAWAGVAGVAIAYLGATRQLDAVIVAVAIVPIVAWRFASDASRWKPIAIRIAIAAACALPVAGGYLAYNAALTGDPLLPPQQRYMQLKERRGDCFRLGFGPGVGECPITQSSHFGKDGFQPEHAVANTRKRLDAWTRFSFGWAPLVLLPVVGLVGGVLAGGAAARRRAAIAGVFVATVGAYGLFFYHGVAYGARFYYVAFPFAVVLSAAGAVDIARWLARVRHGAMIAGALAGMLPALAVAGMVAQWPELDAHAGKRTRTQDGKQLAVLARPELRHAIVFVDSQIIPAAAREHPAAIAENHPIVVTDHGDASNAGFARLYPDRAPYRLTGTRAVPLRYASDAPMRHEGGAQYPLQRATGGFGQRVPKEHVAKLPLSNNAALQFTTSASRSRFAFPIWVHAADAGELALAIQIAHHANGPACDLAVDGVRVASGIATSSTTGWRLEEHAFRVALAAGQHWLEIEIPSSRPGQSIYVDYVELRGIR